ncbi:hypothetical protein EYF80_009494 [Liparis tanakae]|uniref:Uncharacterized protein n=1 Tax=Liparis tanakae TaxID=230148 RepID=A0A4Z2IQD0_9TELE|nr:hypothetical protein EYF80_009494 [Liparis tanakae]
MASTLTSSNAPVDTTVVVDVTSNQPFCSQRRLECSRQQVGCLYISQSLATMAAISRQHKATLEEPRTYEEQHMWDVIGTCSTWVDEPIKQVRVYGAVLCMIRIRISGCVVLLDPAHVQRTISWKISPAHPESVWVGCQACSAGPWDSSVDQLLLAEPAANRAPGSSSFHHSVIILYTMKDNLHACTALVASGPTCSNRRVTLRCRVEAESLLLKDRPGN